MMYELTNVRPGLTAIAAVLALSTTPAVAQDLSADPVDPVPVTSDPVPATDPLAAAPEPAPAETAPEAISETVTADEANDESAAVAKATLAPVAKPAPRRVTAKASPVRAAPAPEAAQAAAEPTASAEAAPAPIDPIAPAAGPAMVSAEPDATPKIKVDEKDVIPAAGAGLGVLALAGMGMAVRRRRRHDDSEELMDEADAIEPEAVAEPDLEPAPVAVAAPIHDPTPARGQSQSLPSGFDLSRFGPHVQAAYRGPTPDNPSLSLKRRLSRARALDQRNRVRGMPAAEPTAADRPASIAARPMTVSFSGATNVAKRPEFSF